MIARSPTVLLSLCIAACLGCATATAGLSPPDGPHAVGVVRSEFVDDARTLDADDPGSGPRRLPAVVWYPAQAEARGQTSPYLAADGAAVVLPALQRLFGYPEQELQALAAAPVAAVPDATPARTATGFPVVVYSHGLFLYPEQNSALAARLASHGYIVVSIGHPGDSADIRLSDGRVVATRTGGVADDPRFADSWKVLAGGADLAVRRTALDVYAAALPGTRIGASLMQWREDTLLVAAALADGRAPDALRAVLAQADRDRLAFAGMSFGGATAATSCRLVDACRAAVNLDGQNFDPALYDRPVQRPLLLMLSDWPQYGLLEGQPREPDFSPNDLAYEPWASTGADARVVRVRLQGARHLGFTDLVALLDGPKRNERVGDIDADRAQAAIGDTVLAFLGAHLGDGDPAAIDSAIARHPALVRHATQRLQRWIDEERATDTP